MWVERGGVGSRATDGIVINPSTSPGGLQLLSVTVQAIQCVRDTGLCPSYIVSPAPVPPLRYAVIAHTHSVSHIYVNTQYCSVDLSKVLYVVGTFFLALTL